MASPKKYNVFFAHPGIAGLSKISDIDMSPPKLLAETDAKMITNQNIKSFFNHILIAVIIKGQGDVAKC